MSAAPPPPSKQTPDWKAIEADYRAGIKTLRQIASEHGISHVAVNNKAKRLEWTRDLSHKIKAAADAIVAKAAITSSITKTDELVIVKVNADIQANIRIAQQNRIDRSVRLIDSMFIELETMSDMGNQGLIEALMDACKKPDHVENEEEIRRRRKRQEDMLEKVLSLPSRVEVGKKLMEMLEKGTNMQRVVYGIKTVETDTGGELADFVRALGAKGSALPVSHVLEPEDA